MQCNLINYKNLIFRRKQHNFEEEHAELEYQIRVLMSKPDHTKTDTEKAREEELIRRYVLRINIIICKNTKTVFKIYYLFRQIG